MKRVFIAFCILVIQNSKLFAQDEAELLAKQNNNLFENKILPGKWVGYVDLTLGYPYAVELNFEKDVSDIENYKAKTKATRYPVKTEYEKRTIPSTLGLNTIINFTNNKVTLYGRTKGGCNYSGTLSLSKDNDTSYSLKGIITSENCADGNLKRVVLKRVFTSAEANEILKIKQAANIVYNRKYGDKTIKILEPNQCTELFNLRTIDTTKYQYIFYSKFGNKNYVMRQPIIMGGPSYASEHTRFIDENKYSVDNRIIGLWATENYSSVYKISVDNKNSNFMRITAFHYDAQKGKYIEEGIPGIPVPDAFFVTRIDSNYYLEFPHEEYENEKIITKYYLAKYSLIDNQLIFQQLSGAYTNCNNQFDQISSYKDYVLNNQNKHGFFLKECTLIKYNNLSTMPETRNEEYWRKEKMNKTVLMGALHFLLMPSLTASCGTCNGSGHKGNGICSTCSGSGQISKTACYYCNGVGKIGVNILEGKWGDTCPKCEGVGY